MYIALLWICFVWWNVIQFCFPGGILISIGFKVNSRKVRVHWLATLGKCNPKKPLAQLWRMKAHFGLVMHLLIRHKKTAILWSAHHRFSPMFPEINFNEHYAILVLILKKKPHLTNKKFVFFFDFSKVRNICGKKWFELCINISWKLQCSFRWFHHIVFQYEEEIFVSHTYGSIDTSLFRWGKFQWLFIFWYFKRSCEISHGAII